MKKHIFTTFLALICAAAALNAQVKVSGTVLDKDGAPVIGAGVVEQGTLNGTTTGADGTYILSVASDKSVLEFSCIGFETVQQTVGNRQVIDIQMQEDSKLLDEVVVIGYGTVKKKDLTGAVAAVDGGKLSAIQGVGLSQALQGSMPGVQVTRTSGLPGAGATIRVRGRCPCFGRRHPHHHQEGQGRQPEHRLQRIVQRPYPYPPSRAGQPKALHGASERGQLERCRQPRRP